MSFDSFRKTFSHKNVLLFGFGILGGGKASLNTFQQIPCQLIITDQKSEVELADSLSTIDTNNIVKMTLGHHSFDDIDWADVIIKNPAVPTSNEYIQYAFKKNKYVTTDASLYLRYAQAKTIGITGTRGKTTTTLLTHHLLSNGLTTQVLLGGNIKDVGSLPLLLSETANSVAVLELSSFALEGCHWEKVSPQLAAITNLYPDHMNRHSSMDEYAYEKSAIFAYQRPEDHVFLNKENEWTTKYQSQVHSQMHLIDPQEIEETSQMPLKGSHNLFNAAFAISIAKTLQVSSEDIKKNLLTFVGAPFRQQNIGTIHGITFVNDSTSTTPEAVLAALETFPHASFIIGGTTKQLDVQKLAVKLDQHSGPIYFLKGSGTSELISKMQKKPVIFDTLTEAFQAAIRNNPTEVVFSPGFTSFELFKNEFDRAEQFSKLVQKLAT